MLVDLMQILHIQWMAVNGRTTIRKFQCGRVTVTCHGVNVHPGSAKNAMVNAISLGQQFNSLLPSHEVPERTEGYERVLSFNEFYR